MSGWLTPKLVRTKKLRGFPWAVPQAREEVNTQLGVKTHDPDAGTPRYGQLRAGGAWHQDIGWVWVRAHACTREGSAGQCTAHKCTTVPEDDHAWRTPSRART